MNITKTFSRFYEYLIFALILIIAITLSVNSSLSNAILKGIELWAVCVLPSVFPYFFISQILCSLSVTKKIANFFSPVMNKLFNLSGICAYAFFMSVIAGYPLGAKIISDLRKDKLISSSEAVRASALCSTSSPMFLISSVGGIMFNSLKFGVLLLITNFLSAIVIGVIFSFYKRKDKPLNLYCTILSNGNGNFIFDNVSEAVTSTLFVGGMITLFYLLTEILVELKILTPLNFIIGKIFNDQNFGSSIGFGIFEYTKGLRTLSLSPQTFFTLPVACFICGFGGVSIIMQSVAFLRNAKIKTAPFILSKFIGAVIGFLIGLILALLLLS